MAAMESAGATVAIARGDVIRREDVARVVGRIRASMPPLGGVVHAAGVIDDGALVDQSWLRFASVLAPKIEGAWNLHIETLTDPLEFFVLFSSIAPLIGSPGQGAYAAANAWLDGLASYRRSAGLCGQSLAWGPWSQVGMAAGVDRNTARRWEESGIGTISPERGALVFDSLLGEGPPYVAVAPADWSRVASALATGGMRAVPPLFTTVVDDAGRASAP